MASNPVSKRGEKEAQVPRRTRQGSVPSRFSLPSWVFGSVLLAFLLGVFFFAPISLPEFKQRILAVMCSLLGAIFAFFMSGDIALRLAPATKALGRVALKATGGLAVFIFMLWWWMSPLALVSSVDHPRTVSPSSGQTLLDSTKGLNGFDVQGKQGYFWDVVGPEPKKKSAEGKGNLRVEDGGILNLQRTNTAGRFELRFQRYSYNGKEYSKIPVDVLISGQRKLRVSGEAKATKAGDREHALRFVFKNTDTGAVLAKTSPPIAVKSNEWTKFEVFLFADPHQECILRIDDEIGKEDDNDLSVASSVQIRNILLVQEN